MEFKKILCAIDLEHDITEELAKTSAQIAKNNGAQLILLNVVEKEIPLLLAEEIIALSPNIRDIDEIFEGVKKKSVNKIQGIAKNIKDEYNIDPHWIVEIGEPVEIILEVAEREGVDLIIVGSLGKSGLEKFLIGSVSEGVAKKAKCSVLIIKRRR